MKENVVGADQRNGGRKNLYIASKNYKRGKEYPSEQRAPISRSVYGKYLLRSEIKTPGHLRCLESKVLTEQWLSCLD